MVQRIQAGFSIKNCLSAVSNAGCRSTYMHSPGGLGKGRTASFKYCLYRDLQPWALYQILHAWRKIDVRYVGGNIFRGFLYISHPKAAKRSCRVGPWISRISDHQIVVHPVKWGASQLCTYVASWTIRSEYTWYSFKCLRNPGTGSSSISQFHLFFVVNRLLYSSIWHLRSGDER